MKSDLLLAVTQLAAERSLPHSVVLSAIQEALVSAYKRDAMSGGQDVTVTLDSETGEMHVKTVRTVVEDGAELEDPATEIHVSDAKKLDPNATVGQYVVTGEIRQNPGRIAAQTAKQVVMQRLREAERDLVFGEFQDKKGEVLTVTVSRIDSRQITLDLGRAEAIMPPSEQVPTERYRPGYKIKVYIVDVGRSARGPEIIASRTHPDLIRRLFEAEVPEIFNGVVEIKGIAREPGFRSKVAVASNQEGVDAVGACVGLRGIRIQNVVNELHGEKIDVVEYDEDPATFIANSLSPAQVESVVLDHESKSATVIVPDRALSLAIGREGQNARLAAKLTDWRIDIKASSVAAAEAAAAAPEPEPEVVEPEPVAEAAAEQFEPAAEPITAEAAPVELEAEPASVEPEPALEPVAELDAEPATARPEAVAPAEPAAAEAQTVSPEEELALRALEEELAALEREEEAKRRAAEEAEQVIDFTSDDIWKVSDLAGDDASSGLRFAEDIIGYRDQSGPRRRGRGRRGGENLSPKARRAAARKSSGPDS